MSVEQVTKATDNAGQSLLRRELAAMPTVEEIVGGSFQPSDGTTMEIDSDVAPHRQITFRHILASEIITPAYQRQVAESLVKRIATNFNQDLFDSLLVNRRADGKWYVIDGQQRLTGIRRRDWGDKKVLCRTYEGLTEDEEAAIYLGTQTSGARKGLSALDKFKARLFVGDARALQINAVIRSLGLRVNFTLAPGLKMIRAIDAVERTATRHNGGIDHLTAVLDTLNRAWGDSYPEAFQQQLISGLSEFLIRYGDRVDRELLVDKLKRIDPRVVLRLMTTFTMGSTSIGARKLAGARAFHDLYNKNTRKRRLPEWA